MCQKRSLSRKTKSYKKSINSCTTWFWTSCKNTDPTKFRLAPRCSSIFQNSHPRVSAAAGDVATHLTNFSGSKSDFKLKKKSNQIAAVVSLVHNTLTRCRNPTSISRTTEGHAAERLDPISQENPERSRVLFPWIPPLSRTSARIRIRTHTHPHPHAHASVRTHIRIHIRTHIELY